MIKVFFSFSGDAGDSVAESFVHSALNQGTYVVIVVLIRTICRLFPPSSASLFSFSFPQDSLVNLPPDCPEFSCLCPIHVNGGYNTGHGQINPHALDFAHLTIIIDHAPYLAESRSFKHILPEQKKKKIMPSLNYRGAEMVAIVTVLVGISFLAVLLRVYARFKRQVRFGIDDYLCFVSMGLLFAMLIELGLCERLPTIPQLSVEYHTD